jgi:hypothetical protein
MIRVGRKMTIAARTGWAVQGGKPLRKEESPSKRVSIGLALHRCDNNGCVRKSHLSIGTQSDNCIDRERKGRGFDTRGDNNGMAKVTNDERRRMREMVLEGVRVADIAAKYGLRECTVYRIIKKSP